MDARRLSGEQEREVDQDEWGTVVSAEMETHLPGLWQVISHETWLMRCREEDYYISLEVVNNF